MLLPINFFTRKGSRLHVRLGHVMSVIAAVLLVGALLTVVNPDFPAYWADDIERHNWEEWLSIFGLGRAFLIWVFCFYLYFFASSLRIWMRRRSTDDVLSAGSIDYVLTAIALGFGGYYGFISVYQAIESSYGYPRLLPMSVTLVTFAVWDVVTYVRPTQSWNVSYFSHGLRLYMAWWMLVVGMLIRQTSQYTSDDQNVFGEYGTTVLILLALGALCLLWRRALVRAPRG